MNDTPLPLTVCAMRASRPFGLAGRKHVHEGLQVVPVDGAHVPAEGRELGAQVARIAHLARAAVDLQAVAVHDGGQVVQTAMGSEHGRLPHLTFLALAVAQKREHGAAVPVERQAGGAAGGDGEPLPQRPGGHFHAGQLVGVGMALQARAQLAQGRKLFAREVACLCERCVESRRRMAFRQEEPVAAGLLRVCRVVLQHAAEVQRREDVGT